MIYSLLLLLTPFCIANHDKDPHVSEHFIELDRVESLVISGGYYVTIAHGDPGIKISGSPKAMDMLNIDQKAQQVALSYHPQEDNGWFSRFFKNKNYNTDHYKLKIEITLPNLDVIALHGTSHASIKDDIGIEKIELSGASQLDFLSPIRPRTLDIELRGASFLATKGIKANQILLQQSGTSRSVFSELKIREYGIFNVSGKASVQSTFIHANQLKLEGSGTSLYSVNTLKGRDITLELYGVSSATIKSLKAHSVTTFLHGSSHAHVRSAEIKKHHEHNTGMASIQYDELTKL